MHQTETILLLYSTEALVSKHLIIICQNIYLFSYLFIVAYVYPLNSSNLIERKVHPIFMDTYAIFCTKHKSYYPSTTWYYIMHINLYTEACNFSYSFKQGAE